MPDQSQRARDEYLAAILEPNPARAREVVRAAVREGLGIRDAYEAVIASAMVEVGRLWETDAISVAHEHLATEVSSSLVAELASRLETEPTTGRLAVVCCSPEENHCLGGLMLSGLLEAAGWEVLFLGTTLPRGDLVALAEDEAADVVALSTTMPHNLPHVQETIEAVQALDDPPLVLVGGQAYSGEADARGVGADAWAASAGEAPELLRRRLPPAA